MQIKTSKRGILVDASRKDAIYEAVRLLDLAGELMYDNTSVALDMINDVKARNLKELEHIADTMGYYVEEIMEKWHQNQDSDPGPVLN